MREILLSRGLVTIVDDDDHVWLRRHKWCVTSGGYATRGVHTPGKNGKKTWYRMHREILAKQLGNDAISGKDVDHINGNPLDNRKQNLRPATRSQNLSNKRFSERNTSGFRGVTWAKRERTWFAQIKVHGKCRHLGYFRDPIEAARAFDAAALKYRGEFAQLNFPEQRCAS